MNRLQCWRRWQSICANFRQQKRQHRQQIRRPSGQCATGLSERVPLLLVHQHNPTATAADLENELWTLSPPPLLTLVGSCVPIDNILSADIICCHRFCNHTMPQLWLCNFWCTQNETKKREYSPVTQGLSPLPQSSDNCFFLFFLEVLCALRFRAKVATATTSLSFPVCTSFLYSG